MFDGGGQDGPNNLLPETFFYVNDRPPTRDELLQQKWSYARHKRLGHCYSAGFLDAIKRSINHYLKRK